MAYSVFLLWQFTVRDLSLQLYQGLYLLIVTASQVLTALSGSLYFSSTPRSTSCWVGLMGYSTPAAPLL